jgi:hypothetical protein
MDSSLVSNVTVSSSSTTPRSVWIGRVLTGLVAAFLVFDGAVKLAPIAPVVEAMTRLGYDVGVARPLGVLLIVSTLLHLIPRTRFLGALLVTAYLGGAVATHVRVADPFFFPPLMGLVLWIGYYLRDARVRALIGR